MFHIEAYAVLLFIDGKNIFLELLSQVEPNW